METNKATAALLVEQIRGNPGNMFAGSYARLESDS